MNYDVSSIEEYIDALEEDRKSIIKKIYGILKKHLPKGFEEAFQYNMISFVVPLSRYPKGYLNRKDEALPFISLASQKHHIAIYHYGIYSNTELLTWAQNRYKELMGRKLDMGKSCLRFKKMNEIPYTFIEELAEKMSVEEFIESIEQVGSRHGNE